jgi:hypothetical protein
MQMRYLLPIALIGAWLSAGCLAPEKRVEIDVSAVTKRLHYGMTEDEVVRVIGKSPQSRIDVGPMQSISYSDSKSDAELVLDIEHGVLHGAKLWREDEHGTLIKERIRLAEAPRKRPPATGDQPSLYE